MWVSDAGRVHHSARTLVASSSVGPDALVDFVRENQGNVDGVKVVATEGLGYGLIANKVRAGYVQHDFSVYPMNADLC
jgi:hypothetical protein